MIAGVNISTVPRAVKLSGKTIIPYDGTGEVLGIVIDAVKQGEEVTYYSTGTVNIDGLGTGSYYATNKGVFTKTAGTFHLGFAVSDEFAIHIDKIVVTDAEKTNYDTAYAHSQTTHAPANAQKNSDITQAEIEAKLTGTISTHTHAGGSASWGGITGTLSNQTDLQTALNAKRNTVNNFATGSMTIPTEQYYLHACCFKLTNSQSLTIQGTGVLRIV